MARRKSTPRASTPLFAAVILAVVAFGLVAWMSGSSRSPLKLGNNGAGTQPAPLPPITQPSHRVDIYITKVVEDDARLVPVERIVPVDADEHKAALEELLKTNENEEGPAKYLIPQGSRLLGLKINNGTAYADFNNALKENFPGGSMNEALLVNAIVHTLTQFDDVKRVQIMVEGKKIESLGGHLEISQPITGDSALLGKGEAE